MSRRFTVVCADLRGYGSSGCPASTADHAPYAKRAMARDMVVVMERLGSPRFSVAGHDRGGRVAYRLALDHPEAVERLAVLDIVPTGTVWETADARLALAYWPWSLLAQPQPLPERLIEAAASIDRSHDEADRTSGRRIARPLLTLWSGLGPLSTWYTELGGPLAIWRTWGDDVEGRALDAGHFFPEEIPDETADALGRFFAGPATAAPS